jgi:hypothetical protein
MKIKVYRFDHYGKDEESKIVETFIDKIGYPNVDSDGHIWQEGEHFKDYETAKKYAIKYLLWEIDYCRETLENLQKQMNIFTASLHKLILSENDKRMSLLDYLNKIKKRKKMMENKKTNQSKNI